MNGSSTARDAISGALDAFTASFGLMGHNAWYALLYTIVVAGFGFRAAQRWGKNDPHQRYRYASIIFFQVFFFLLVEVGLYYFFGAFETNTRSTTGGAGASRSPSRCSTTASSGGTRATHNR